MAVTEISPQELQRRLLAGEPLQLLDVREPWEVAIAALPGSTHIPLQQIPRRLKEIQSADVVVLCKSGGRSRRAAEFLQSAGFQQVANLTGGIDAWTADIDPALPSY